MTDDCRVFILLREFDAIQGLGQRPDLIHFYENGISDPAIDRFAQKLNVGHQEVVSDELHLCAHGVGEFFPAVPIILRAAVFERDDGKLFCQFLIVRDQLLDVALGTIRFLEHV